ncbi:hypothetical protein N566_03295, partial [Streptomycetaceae bacterium MP113-05]
GARTALAATPAQLAVLARAGVVDAGGRGLIAVLDALTTVLTGEAPPAPEDPSTTVRAVAGESAVPVPCGPDSAPDAHPHRATGPAYEVMYLLDADEPAVHALRDTLDALGDSLVVIGGDGLWNVHVHVDDAGAAVEAGIAVGRPHRVRIAHLLSGSPPHGPRAAPGPLPPLPTASSSGTAPEDSAPRLRAAGPEPARSVVAVVRGEGLAGLCEEAGACVVRVPADGGAEEDSLFAAVRRCGAHETVLLPNDPYLHGVAVRAAERARDVGVRAAVIPTRAAVQGIAALAVHDPGVRFDEDVVAMTSAAGATRYGEVTVAGYESWTMAGVCQAGDVLGLVEGDVAVIGEDLAGTAADVLERMLAAGGEMVTLVVGPHAPEGLAERLEAQVRHGHLGVDTVVYEGREGAGPLLIGVE